MDSVGANNVPSADHDDWHAESLLELGDEEVGALSKGVQGAVWAPNKCVHTLGAVSSGEGVALSRVEEERSEVGLCLVLVLNSQQVLGEVSFEIGDFVAFKRGDLAQVEHCECLFFINDYYF